MLKTNLKTLMVAGASALMAAQAQAVSFNTSFAFTAFGVEPSYVSPSVIGLSTSLTLPASGLIVSFVVDPYLGSPNNLLPGLTLSDAVSFSPTTITIPGGGAGPTSLPLFTFHGPTFDYTFTPSVGLAAHPAAGDHLNLTFVGTVTGGAFDPTPAGLTLTFSQTVPGAAISMSGTFQAPPSTIHLPDAGASLALLGLSMIGLTAVNRRKLALNL